MHVTGKGLVEHWDWAANKGLMNKNSAAALRAACAQVLGVLEDWENIDIATIDSDDVVRRFKNLRARNFKPKSLETYEKRFKKALSSYLAYVRDPGAWKPAKQTRAPKTDKDQAQHHGPQSTSEVPRSDSLRSGLVDYPFPLRDGQTARLMLPRDLKIAEVKRLSAFMSTLAVDNAMDDPDQLQSNNAYHQKRSVHRRS